MGSRSRCRVEAGYLPQTGFVCEGIALSLRTGLRADCYRYAVADPHSVALANSYGHAVSDPHPYGHADRPRNRR